jgi:hypothetical protein
VRRSLIAAASAVLVLGLSACGGQRVPEYGTVTGKDHHDAWVQVIPGSTICNGKTCSTTPMQVIPHPETWEITIQDTNNKDWNGTVTDHNSDTYNKCDVGQKWPDCWKGGQW